MITRPTNKIEWTAAKSQYCTELLARLVDAPSVFPNEEPALLVLERELTELELAPTRIELSPGRFNILCTIGSGSPRLCLNAHVDTVPPSGKSVPHARIEGDFLYGLGSCDDKASIVAMIMAFKSLAERKVDLGCTVDLLLSVDEECRGQGIPCAIEQGYRCDYAIVGEPTELNVVAAHSGIFFPKLTTRGVSGHGSTPDYGANAIDRMFSLVTQIKAVVADMAPHPLIGKPSLNLGLIHGGDRPNRIPDKCEAALDIRVVPPMPAKDILARIEKICQSVEWAELEVIRYNNPMDTATDSPLVTAVTDGASELGLQCNVIGWRGCTDAEGFQTGLQIDTVVLGPGSLAQAHSADEFVSISQVRTAADLYASVVQQLYTNR